MNLLSFRPGANLCEAGLRIWSMVINLCGHIQCTL